VAKSLGAVVIAIVTMPFTFEMGRRQKNARQGLAKLQPFADTLITVPNDRLLQIAPVDLPIEMAFRLADDILRQGVQGISELVTTPGLINVDFSHVKNLMKNGGGSLLAIGNGQGDNQAVQAVERALHHPMLESVNLENASGIIANFTGGDDLSFGEVTDALVYLQQKTSARVEIIPGVVNDKRMQDRTQVTLVITGIGGEAMDSSLKFEGIHKKVESEVEQPLGEDISSYLQPRTPERVSLPQFEMAGTPSDLDIPAFMRRRPR
jgi:cell division protein FtsZ